LQNVAKELRVHPPLANPRPITTRRGSAPAGNDLFGRFDGCAFSAMNQRSMVMFGPVGRRTMGPGHSGCSVCTCAAGHGKARNFANCCRGPGFMVVSILGRADWPRMNRRASYKPGCFAWPCSGGGCPPFVTPRLALLSIRAGAVPMSSRNRGDQGGGSFSRAG